MTIGNQLKKARQKKEVAIEEAYQCTRIHPKVLTALEEDKYDEILNQTYIRSFLKEYASYLGLNVADILKEYDNLHKKGAVAVQTPTTQESKIALPDIDIEKVLKAVKVILVWVVCVTILIFVVKGIGRIAKKKIEAPLAQKLDLKAKKPTPPKEKKAALVKKEIPKKQPPKTTPPTQGKALVAQGVKLALSVTVTDDVWLQVKVDDKIIFQNVLKKGSSETWEAGDNFKIWTAKSEALQLKLNGIDLGSAGTGAKKYIIITKEGIRR